MVIALTGEKLAGKGTVAQYLQTQRPVKVIRFSQVLVDILQRLHKDASRAELVSLGQGLRTLYGDDVLAQVVHDDVQKQPDQVWIIDGMRFVREYDLLAPLPKFYLLNITADLKIRYDRTRSRLEKSDEAAMTLAEFTQREQDSTEQEIPLLQQRADHTIHNVSTVAVLYQQLDQWLADIG